MSVKRALQLLPDPDPRGERRILRRFARTRAERRHRVVHGLSLASLALAVAVLAWVIWPAGPRTLSVAGGPETAERILWSDQVDLTVAGSGDIGGTEDDVVVDWRHGLVRVDVEEGAQLAIQTDEGRVESQGPAKGVRVLRDALGFTTTVEEGSVRVACADGARHVVASGTGPSQPWTCWPTSPARLLGRADALEDRGAPRDKVRATLDHALTGWDGHDEGAVWGELLVRRMHVRAELGDVSGALADADAYVGFFGARKADVHRFAGALAVEATADCAAALPHLDAIERDADFAWLRDVCRRRVSGDADGALVDQIEVTEPSERVRRWAQRLDE